MHLVAALGGLELVLERLGTARSRTCVCVRECVCVCVCARVRMCGGQGPASRCSCSFYPLRCTASPPEETALEPPRAARAPAGTWSPSAAWRRPPGRRCSCRTRRAGRPRTTPAARRRSCGGGGYDAAICERALVACSREVGCICMLSVLTKHVPLSLSLSLSLTHTHTHSHTHTHT